MNVAGIAIWGTDRGPRARALAADDRRQPDRADQRPRVLRAADDRGRRGGHVVNVSSAAGLFGTPLARSLQRRQVRPARGLRGAALRPPPTPDRRQPGLPGSGQDAAGRHGRDRRGRSGPATDAEADRPLRAPRGQPRARRRADRRRDREATASWSSPRSTSGSATGSSASSRRRMSWRCVCDTASSIGAAG